MHALDPNLLYSWGSWGAPHLSENLKIGGGRGGLLIRVAKRTDTDLLLLSVLVVPDRTPTSLCITTHHCASPLNLIPTAVARVPAIRVVLSTSSACCAQNEVQNSACTGVNCLSHFQKHFISCPLFFGQYDRKEQSCQVPVAHIADVTCVGNLQNLHLFQQKKNLTPPKSQNFTLPLCELIPVVACPCSGQHYLRQHSL